MDYEKKYNKLVEAVKQLQKANPSDECIHNWINDNVPELAESEEWIRSELISLVRLDGWHPIEWTREKKNKMIAWLEKQGEQKSKKVPIWKHWKNGIAGNGEGEPIYLTKVGNTYSLNSCLGFECDYIELSELDNLMLEKQGEQNPYSGICDFDSECVWDLVEKKPTEWSLPYEKNKTAEKLIALAEILEMDGDCLFNGVSGNSYGKFLRVLAKELTEVKLAWSKEDEKWAKYLKEMLDYNFRNFTKFEPDAVGAYNWLETIKQRIGG